LGYEFPRFVTNFGYVKSLESGRINPQPQVQINCDRATMVRIDGDAAPGQDTGKLAMETAITR
jgi:LDH2 family malate/lactate/ureidoglycolate dehydrogenase